MKNKKMHFAAKAMLVCSIGLLPLISFAQKDSTKHESAKSKFSVGLEVNTLGNGSLNNEYNYPYYYYYVGYNGYLYPYNNTGNFTTTFKSFSFGFRANYYLSNDLSLKFKLGTKNTNIVGVGQDTNGGGYQQSTTTTQRNYYLAVGCQYDLHLSKLAYIYVGMDLTFSYYGTFNEAETVTSNYPIYATTLTSPGGVTIGLGPVIGFAFNPSNHVGLGAEITQAIVYESLGGAETETQTGGSGYNNYNRSFTNKVNGWTNSGNLISLYVSFLF